MIGRSWFALLGQTPEAYAAAMLMFDLLIAWGLARCAYALRAGPVGVILILFTMLATTLGSYINLAHACEATLICHALAEHANGRRPRALALLTACLFAKPVMAYLYGFLFGAPDRPAWRNVRSHTLGTRRNRSRCVASGGACYLVRARACTPDATSVAGSRGL